MIQIQGIYETIRADNFIPQNFKAHYNRFKQSANELGLKMSYTETQLFDYLKNSCLTQNLPQARIRITLQGNNFTTIITPLEALPKPPYKAITIDLERENPTFKHTNLKITNLAQNKAKQSNAIDAILINQKGFATEGSITNLFIVSNDNTLITNQDFCLKGTMQSLVIQAAKELKIDLEIRPISKKELETAKEIFLTNAIKRIIPLDYLNNTPLQSNQLATQLIQHLKFDKN